MPAAAVVELEQVQALQLPFSSVQTVICLSQSLEALEHVGLWKSA